MKPLYKQFYQKNVFFNLFVNTGSLRKEKFHLGDYSRSTEVNEAGVNETKIKTRYYQHKEFGSQAARETAISENIYDNYKGLVANRSKIKEYSEFEINFFKAEILYFSSTNKTLFIEFFL